VSDAREPEEPPHPQSDGNRRHILIVEDSYYVSDALRLLFEQTGRRVTVAHTVADAIAAAELDPPQLTLLDLTLPDGDGLQVAERLRAIQTGVVVALTGRDEPEVARRCRAAGCREVLVKPVETRTLLRRVGEWLDADVPATAAPRERLA
jgi:DNA-binding response OmpR family regulator